ncbi:MAG: MoxR family ATPase [Lachnospiraceae bacterium]|nr:MoxR family ATPase [Lachnospiraceae bacterium]
MRVLEQVGSVIYGKEKEILEIMLTFLSGGNVLLEDIPGVGKTTLALAFSKAMDLEFKRIQFTPDVLPSDITGYNVYRRDTGKFEYREGAVFCNLLLADELNRTSPKTQSALLEVMQEKQVTVEGETRMVPEPFFVIATQNPTGSAGTQGIPESQVDRFMTGLTLGYPDRNSELRMVTEKAEDTGALKVETVMTGDELMRISGEISQIFIKDSVGGYIVDLIERTRSDELTEGGVSPRATIALSRMSRASAWLDGRDFVTPEDVSEQFPYIIRHRLRLGRNAAVGGRNRDFVVKEILKSVRKPAYA